MSEEEREAVDESFCPGDYLNFSLEVLVEGVKFFLTKIHSVLKNGRFSGTSCLEIGCGPTVHMVALASKYYDNVLTSEYLEVNRKYVEAWIKKEKDHPSFDHFFKFIAKLEDFSDLDKGAEEISIRLRSKIKGVVPCDFNQQNILPMDRMQEFDLVMTSLAIDVACDSVPDLFQALKNTAKLVKKGGGFMMMGVLGSTFWLVEEHRYFCLPLNKEIIDEGLQEAGFGKMEWTIIGREDKRFDLADQESVFFVVCEKL